MEDLIEDLKCLTYCGSAQSQGSRIWQSSANPENSSKIQYFVQDWNQVLWKSREEFIEKPGMLTSIMVSARVETENIYLLTLVMLEISGLDIKRLKSLSGEGRHHHENIKMALEELLKKLPNSEAVVTQTVERYITILLMASEMYLLKKGP